MAQRWRRIRDDSRVIQPEPDQPVYRPDQFEAVVENILLFQRANGGWPKDYDMLAVLTVAQKDAVCASRERNDTSFDNHNTHSQVDYLARAYDRCRNEAWRASCERGSGIDAAAQRPNGGFPQRFPNPQGYSAHVTFNDGVMIGILNVLKDAADGLPHWRWLDAVRWAAAPGPSIVAARHPGLPIPRGRPPHGLACQQHDARSLEAAPCADFRAGLDLSPGDRRGLPLPDAVRSPSAEDVRRGGRRRRLAPSGGPVG